MITVIQQDLLTLNCDVIAHQVNCKGVMGSGLAYQIRKHYPKVYAKYRKACALSDLLGKVQVISTDNYFVANLFAQFNFGTTQQHTDYNALALCLIKLRDHMLSNNLTTLGLPYGLGCGLAGGNWNVVSHIIKDVFTPTDITVYICKK